DGGGLGRALEREKTRAITRKGKRYRVCCGDVERVIVNAWTGVIENAMVLEHGEREALHAFQRGGILERLNSPDAAARYVSKEASKRTQKGRDVNLGKGCFWRLARHLKARARFAVGITKPGLGKLPSYSRIFDRQAAL